MGGGEVRGTVPPPPPPPPVLYGYVTTCEIAGQSQICKNIVKIFVQCALKGYPSPLILGEI